MVNMDEHARLGVLRGQVVAVDGHSPPLVSQQFCIAIQAADRGSELGAEQKDVDSAEHGRLVQKICHRFLQSALGEVGNQMAVNDNSRATLSFTRPRFSNRAEEDIGGTLGRGRAERTNERGVWFRMDSLVCWTRSAAPDRHTVVTWPRTIFGVAEMTWASMGIVLAVMSLQS